MTERLVNWLQPLTYWPVVLSLFWFDFSSVACFRRQFNSPALKCVLRVVQCVVVSVRLRPRWDTLPRLTRRHLPRPWSVPTPGHCAQARRRIVRRPLPSTLPQSRLTTAPPIHWPALGRWDQWETADMLRAALPCSQHRQFEWFHHYSSRHLATEVHCRRQCMIFLSGRTFLVSRLICGLL